MEILHVSPLKKPLAGGAVAEDDKGFLGRWARRKTDVLQGKPADKPMSAPVPAVVNLTDDADAERALDNAGPQKGVHNSPQSPPASQQDLPPALTLDDARLLTKDSDFRPFMTGRADPGVRNAAMKKLFSDPHYNVMDGLDIYIDDYTKSDPIPESMLRQMVGAKFLKLFDEEEDEKKEEDVDKSETAALSRENANNSALQIVAQSSDCVDSKSPKRPDLNLSQINSQPEPPQMPGSGPSQQDHANTDLRLQPDHAAPAAKAGRCAE